MASAKTLCAAIAVLAGTILLPAARAQDSQDQQKVSRRSVVAKTATNREPAQEPRTLGGSGAAGRRNPGGMFGDPTRWYRYPSPTDQQPAWNSVFRVEGDRWMVGSGRQPEVHLVAADDSLRELLDLPKNQGIVVISVAPGSSAAAAGIRPNDVLLSLGDAPLAEPKDLSEQLRKADEKPATLTLLRR